MSQTHPQDLSSAYNHRYYATVPVTDTDLSAAYPAAQANRASTYRMPRKLRVDGVGNLIVRYPGMSVDADTIPIDAAMLPWEAEIAPLTLRSTATVTKVTVYY